MSGISMFNRDFLVKIRRKALRRKVWFSALDQVERGILSLASQILDSVKSRVLGVELVKIIAKLMDSMKSPFVKEMETYGLDQAKKLAEQAVEWGYEKARGWVMDPGFIRYVTLLKVHNPLWCS